MGPTGRIIGIDMKDTKLEIARRHAPMLAGNTGYARSHIENSSGEAD